MKKSAILVFSFLLLGCMTASDHRREVQDNSAESLTVGKVQREIKVGMTSADVVGVLGSPNLVSTDEERREVWVYDKVSSNVTYSQSNGLATLILIGTDRVAGSASTEQRTLTVIVKFDNEGKVRDFAYHASKF